MSLFQCAWCKRGLQETFFRANGSMICTTCAARVLAAMPRDSMRIFWHSVAWGAAASVALGLALYVGGRLLLQKQGGWAALIFAALGVGCVIGTVMRRASGGASGRRYQIAAALLVYMAVAVSGVALFLGPANLPIAALPFLVLGPLAWLFVGRNAEAGLIMTMALVGIRWAWGTLQPGPLQIIGPEILSSSGEEHF